MRSICLGCPIAIQPKFNRTARPARCSGNCRSVKPSCCPGCVWRVNHDAVEHQAVELKGSDVVSTLESVTRGIQLRADRTLKSHVGDLERGLALIVTR